MSQMTIIDTMRETIRQMHHHNFDLCDKVIVAVSELNECLVSNEQVSPQEILAFSQKIVEIMQDNKENVLATLDGLKEYIGKNFKDIS